MILSGLSLEYHTRTLPLKFTTKTERSFTYIRMNLEITAVKKQEKGTHHTDSNDYLHRNSWYS